MDKTVYTPAFLAAVNHAMLYEVSGKWDLSIPGVIDGTNLRACGYVNDPQDRGGETKYGIAKNGNPDLNIASLTWDDAMGVYYLRYWKAGGCDNMPGRVGALHFDGCINHGVYKASKFLQRAVNVLDDGKIGSKTLIKITNYSVLNVCNSICDQRVIYYKSIVASNPTQGKYLKGWLRRIDEMREFTTNINNSF